MVLVPVICPYCSSDQVIKGGKTETGKQRYHCQQTNCSHRSFVLEPAYNGRLPHLKEQIVDLALWRRSVRDGRHRARDLLDRYPSLGRHLLEEVQFAYPRARRDAHDQLADHVDTHAPFPEACP